MLHALDLVGGERAELLDRREHVHELLHALAKEIELAEYLALVEIKLLHFGLGHQLVLGETILLLVGVVQLEARFQSLQQIANILIPQSAEA